MKKWQIFALLGVFSLISIGLAAAVVQYSGTIQSPYTVNGAPQVTAVVSENQTANVGFGTTNNGDCTVGLTGTTFSISCPGVNIDPGAYYVLTVTVTGAATTSSSASLTPQTSDTVCGAFPLSGGAGTGSCKITAGSGSGTAQVTLSVPGT